MHGILNHPNILQNITNIPQNSISLHCEITTSDILSAKNSNYSGYPPNKNQRKGPYESAAYDQHRDDRQRNTYTMMMKQ